MGTKLRHFLIILFSMYPLMVMAQPMSEAQIKESALKRTNEATVWLIEQGLTEYYKNNSDYSWISDKVREQWACTLSSPPSLKQALYDVRFLVNSAGVRHDIISLYHQEFGGKYYEYWAVKEYGRRVDVATTTFSVTEADNEFSERRILKSSPTFFSSYDLNGQAILGFPMDRLDVLSFLEPQLFQNSYTGTELDGYMIYETRAGKYEMRKMNLIEKLRYKNGP